MPMYIYNCIYLYLLKKKKKKHCIYENFSLDSILFLYNKYLYEIGATFSYKIHAMQSLHIFKLLHTYVVDQVFDI